MRITYLSVIYLKHTLFGIEQCSHEFLVMSITENPSTIPILTKSSCISIPDMCMFFSASPMRYWWKFRMMFDWSSLFAVGIRCEQGVEHIEFSILKFTIQIIHAVIIHYIRCTPLGIPYHHQILNVVFAVDIQLHSIRWNPSSRKIHSAQLQICGVCFFEWLVEWLCVTCFHYISWVRLIINQNCSRERVVSQNTHNHVHVQFCVFSFQTVNCK